MYFNARVAIRDAKDPMAFLHLGDLYAKGIGTLENHALAIYFYEKALAMGCKEAEHALDYEYSSCMDIIYEIRKALKNGATNSKRYARCIKHLKRECATPYKDTANELDRFLEQLYAPITKNKKLARAIKKRWNDDCLRNEERELLQAIVNLTHSYNKICRKYNVEKFVFTDLASSDFFPHIKMSLLDLIGKQALGCLLSIKDVSPLMDDYYRNLESDERLLNVSEEVEDQYLQLFLISFVEVNLDIPYVEIIYKPLLEAFKNNQMYELANHLNDFANRLTNVGIEHDLPEFTEENLPPIELGLNLIP